jgi:hypothetical protein
MKKAYSTPELVVIGKFEDVTLSTNTGTTTDAAYLGPQQNVTPGEAALLAPNSLLS